LHGFTCAVAVLRPAVQQQQQQQQQQPGSDASVMNESESSGDTAGGTESGSA
jgi:hypothetical protein